MSFPSGLPNHNALEQLELTCPLQRSCPCSGPCKINWKMVGWGVAYLGKAIANALGQLKLTSLIDEVEALVPDLTVVLDVHCVGCFGHCQSSKGGKSGQNLRQASVA